MSPAGSDDASSAGGQVAPPLIERLPAALAPALVGVRPYLLLAGAFMATRLALYAAGLRLNLDLRWMFLDDIEALRHHLLRTVFYFHAFAPGMNVITGVLLKLSPEHVAGLATGLFWAFGTLMTLSLARILTTLGLPRAAAFPLALAFSLLPQSLFLENLYLYSYLCACLLTAAAVAFERALGRATAWAWFWFFIACAVLGWLYTVFHLVWFALMAGLALLAQARAGAAGWRRALRAVGLGAAFPALLVVGLYAKNYALFGVFGATSWGASNMTLATTQQMRPAERNQWIREGKLSEYAAINVYAAPSAYVDLVPKRVYPWPGSNDLVRPTLGDPNYNHGLFLEVNRARRNDVAYYLEVRPLDYLRRALTRNLPSLFHSTTHWHPHDRKPTSPHREHRAVLGGYESAYDRVVHGWPVPKVGLYVFLPLFLGWAAWSVPACLRARDPGTFARGASIGFCLLQILFVVSASTLFTAWETSRYRYSIEPFIWVLVAAAAQAAIRRLDGWLPSAWRSRAGARSTLDASPAPRKAARMTVSLREDGAGAHGRLAEQSGSPRPSSVSARRLLPHAYDALVLVWLTVFHHVLGVKYRFAQIAYDEHYFLNEGWSVLKGQIPYKDFQEFKPPVIFFVNALGLQLFGLEGLGYRKFLALLSLAGFLALTVALLSRRIHRVLVVAALMLMINHFYADSLHNGVINDAETPALDFFMLGTGVLLTRTQWQRTQQVLGGVLLALSPLSKEPMAFIVVAAWATLLLLHRHESGRRDAPVRFALFTIAGVAGVLATWLAYMLATGSLSWFILQMKLNFAYTQNYAYQLRWASRAPKYGAFAEAIGKIVTRYVNPSHLAVFIPFFVPLGMRWELRRLAGIGALATFLASLYAVSIGSGFATRYFIMAMAGTFFCVVLGVVALDAYAKARRLNPTTLNWMAAAYLGLALIMTLPRFFAECAKYGSYEAPPPPVPQSDIDFVHAHTQPGDKIWTTDDPLLYVFSDRESAFLGGIVLDEIIEYYPGNTDEERLSIVREGLERNRPKLVVFGNNQVGPRRKRRYTKALVMPFLRDGGYIRLNDRFYLRPD